MAGKKVIVVGAGIARLAVPKQLHMLGATVVVLESGNYVGARIRTDWSLGAPFEFGAGWLHGPSRRNPIRKLADSIDAPIVGTDDDNLEVFDMQGQPLTEDDFDRLDSMYERLERTLNRVDENNDTRSIHAVVSDEAPDIMQDPMGRWILSAFTEFDIGAGIEDISAAHALSDEAFIGKDVIFTKGYDTILAPLYEGLDIRLNAPVSKISYHNEGVTVDGMAADYVVCSVPFNPELPVNIKTTIDQIGFGSVTKIALEFDAPFWDISTQYFGIMTEPKGRWNYWLNYRTFSSENILLGLSVGQYAPIADKICHEGSSRQSRQNSYGDIHGTRVAKQNSQSLNITMASTVHAVNTRL
jgi:monoamine oxidase